jgi:hypothetical protein
VSKVPRKAGKKDLSKQSGEALPAQADFDTVLGLIEAARTRAVAAVNTALIDLYWNIGQHISRKIAEEGWGQRAKKS